jgi:hypothetical protein
LSRVFVLGQYILLTPTNAAGRIPKGEVDWVSLEFVWLYGCQAKVWQRREVIKVDIRWM